MTDEEPRSTRWLARVAVSTAALAAAAFVLALVSSDACQSGSASGVSHATGSTSDAALQAPRTTRPDVASELSSRDSWQPTADVAGPDATAGASLETASGSAELDLTGRWAHRTVQTSLTKLPVGGQVTSRTITYRLTDMRHDGKQVSLQVDICDTRIESSTDKIETRIPDAFVESIPVSRRHATLRPGDGISRLVAPRTCSVRGADLAEPASAVLPTSPTSSRVVDADGDGHPGVTVEISGVVSGKIYLVQRGCDAFSGRLLSDDHIRGTVDWSTEQEVLDSTSMFLGNKPPSRPHPDDNKSTFEMVRVDHKTTCRELMDQPETYFKGAR